jgi:hypothetical protein
MNIKKWFICILLLSIMSMLIGCGISNTGESGGNTGNSPTRYDYSRLTAFAQWNDCTANPVVPSGDALEFPKYAYVLYDASKFGGSYSYLGFFPEKTALERWGSNDGTTWIKQNDCSTGGTKVTHICVNYSAGNFTTGHKYKMWYLTTMTYLSSDIHTMDSDDGINWFDDTPLAGNYVAGSSGSWNRGSYGICHVIYNPAAANTGTDPFNYSYVLYFDATTGGEEAIGLAYSSDGVSLNLYGTGPVLAVGGSGKWDSKYASYATIVQENSNTWHMYYSGGTANVYAGIGYAFSHDGLVWTRLDDVPVIGLNNGGTWANPLSSLGVPANNWNHDRNFRPSVIKNGNNLQMWRTGKNGTSYGLGYATCSF